MLGDIDLSNALRLYAITNREWENPAVNLQLQVELAIAGGVTCLAIQDFELTDKKLLPMANEIKSICNTFNIPLIIHDRIDMAIKTKADGICISHKSDLTIDKIKCKLAKAKQEMFIGVTVKDVKESLLAQTNGADYLIARGIFQSKPENPSPITSQEIRQICKVVDIPVIASGGINKSNIAQLADIPIAGTGVMTSIFSSENIKVECEELALRLNYILI